MFGSMSWGNGGINYRPQSIRGEVEVEWWIEMGDAVPLCCSISIQVGIWAVQCYRHRNSRETAKQ